MDRRTFIGGVSKKMVATLVLSSAHLVQAQQTKVYRVGVIHEGGPIYAVVDGLKNGLRELGFEEGKQYLLENRDLKGDRKATEAAARSLEREKVDLIWTEATSVTIEAKHAPTQVPFVFSVGHAAVAAGLVARYAIPARMLTGVSFPH